MVLRRSDDSSFVISGSSGPTRALKQGMERVTDKDFERRMRAVERAVAAREQRLRPPGWIEDLLFLNHASGSDRLKLPTGRLPASQQDEIVILPP